MPNLLGELFLEWILSLYFCFTRGGDYGAGQRAVPVRCKTFHDGESVRSTTGRFRLLMGKLYLCLSARFSSFCFSLASRSGDSSLARRLDLVILALRFWRTGSVPPGATAHWCALKSLSDVDVDSLIPPTGIAALSLNPLAYFVLGREPCLSFPVVSRGSYVCLPSTLLGGGCSCVSMLLMHFSERCTRLVSRGRPA